MQAQYSLATIINRFVILSLLSTLAACATGPQVPLPIPVDHIVIDASKAVDPAIVASASDDAVNAMLDEAWPMDNKSRWLSIFVALLEHNRHISLPQLRNGVSYFNNYQTSPYFYEVVSRYLSAIALGQGSYVETERLLLRNYLSHVVRNAAGADDEELRQARLLCRSLDPELYKKMFM